MLTIGNVEKATEIEGAQAKCEHCGNNPVPHFVNWYFESLNVLFTPIRQALIRNPLSRFLSWTSMRLNLPVQLVLFLKKIKVVSMRSDRTQCKVRRAQVLWEEADKRGIEFHELLLFGKPFDCYMARLHTTGKTLVFSGLPRPYNPTPTALDVMDDKAILKKKFIDAGLPVPLGGSCYCYGQAKKMLSRVQRPVIIKPRLGSRGRHSTTFIYNEKDLKKAFRIAKQLCFWVIVEEQLQGPVYRATVVNGVLQGVLRGDAPFVTGDGVSSLKTLIEAKNKADHPGVKNITVDLRMLVFIVREMAAAGYILDKHTVLDFIPKAGMAVQLTEKIGVNYGGSSSEDFEICHPENKMLFERAASVLGDPIVGFDFIIPDITSSYREQRCGFIEANSLPFINLHHDPLMGKPRNVAAAVWDLVS